MQQTVKMLINQLQHVGIPVNDIHVSMAFYERLGFANIMESTFLQDGFSGTCIMMQNKFIIIELYQLPQHQLAGIKERKDGHIDHIAFDLDDADAAFALLQAASFTIAEPAPVFLSFWQKGCKFFNVIGPDGERLEFNEIIK